VQLVAEYFNQVVLLLHGLGVGVVAGLGGEFGRASFADFAFLLLLIGWWLLGDARGDGGLVVLANLRRTNL